MSSKLAIILILLFINTSDNDLQLQVLGATSGSLSLHHLHITICILYQGCWRISSRRLVGISYFPPNINPYFFCERRLRWQRL